MKMSTLDNFPFKFTMVTFNLDWGLNHEEHILTEGRLPSENKIGRSFRFYKKVYIKTRQFSIDTVHKRNHNN